MVAKGSSPESNIGKSKDNAENRHLSASFGEIPGIHIPTEAVVSINDQVAGLPPQFRDLANRLYAMSPQELWQYAQTALLDRAKGEAFNGNRDGIYKGAFSASDPQQIYGLLTKALKQNDFV
jgi:hypothetical protein